VNLLEQQTDFCCLCVILNVYLAICLYQETNELVVLANGVTIRIPPKPGNIKSCRADSAGHLPASARI